jgi:CO dehydrogenase/acetyl-CoA synthase gamma subunit (corrinoid Fe-S protein)
VLLLLPLDDDEDPDVVDDDEDVDDVDDDDEVAVRRNYNLNYYTVSQLLDLTGVLRK